MKQFRSLIALALVLAWSPLQAQTNPGSSPLSIAKGGTGASTASGARTSLGLAIGSAVQAWDADLDALAALSGTNTIYYRSGANTWTAVTIGGLLSFSGGTLNIGDVELTSIAGLTSAANKLPYYTGSGTAALADFTAFGRSLVDDADAATARATLGSTTVGDAVFIAASAAAARTAIGAVIGTNVQAWDADLDCLAAIGTTGMVARTGAGTCAARTVTAPAAGITVSNGDGVSGNPTLALANDLAAVEGLSGNGCAARTATDTWAVRTVTGTASQITVTNGDCVSGNPTISIPSNAALPGAPTTTTAGANDNSTKIATTAYVDAADALKANAANSALTGLTNISGARKDSTQSAPSQITSNQNDYNPSSVVCATTTTMLVNADAARDVTGIAGGVAGCDLFLFNNGSFAITLKDASASSTAANRFDFGADFVLASKAAVHLKYDGAASRWRNTTGSGSGGGGSGTVTQVVCGTGLTGGTITTSGTCAVDVPTKAEQQTGTATAKAVSPARQQDHDSAAKAWAYCTNSGGTYTLAASYNISGGSCGKSSTGDLTLALAVGFADTNYACVAGSAGAGAFVFSNVVTAGTVRVVIRNSSNTSIDGTFTIQCFGRQ